MASDSTLYNYTMTLDSNSEAVLDFVTRSTSLPITRKLDPLLCKMPIGPADPGVSVFETISIAAAGGQIGTELPPTEHDD